MEAQLFLCNVLPADHMSSLIVNSYLFKLFFSVCSTPLFYVAVSVINSLQRTQRIQVA